MGCKVWFHSIHSRGIVVKLLIVVIAVNSDEEEGYIDDVLSSVSDESLVMHELDPLRFSVSLVSLVSLVQI